jgi:plasmid stabilization system protein ParE
MIGYRLLPPAEEEMTEASLFYESASSGLGQDFLDDVQRVLDYLREHPLAGQSIRVGLKRVPLRRFPFSLIYSIESDAVLIIAVSHQRRRPGYWQSRVQP